MTLKCDASLVSLVTHDDEKCLDGLCVVVALLLDHFELLHELDEAALLVLYGRAAALHGVQIVGADEQLIEHLLVLVAGVRARRTACRVGQRVLHAARGGDVRQTGGAGLARHLARADVDARYGLGLASRHPIDLQVEHAHHQHRYEERQRRRDDRVGYVRLEHATLRVVVVIVVVLTFTNRNCMVENDFGGVCRRGRWRSGRQLVPAEEYGQEGHAEAERPHEYDADEDVPGAHRFAILERLEDGYVAVDGDEQQVKYGSGAARDVERVVHEAEEAVEYPAVEHVLYHGRYHDEQRDGEVRNGQAQQYVVGRILQPLVLYDHRDDERVAREREEHAKGAQ